MAQFAFKIIFKTPACLVSNANMFCSYISQLPSKNANYFLVPALQMQGFATFLNHLSELKVLSNCWGELFETFFTIFYDNTDDQNEFIAALC